MRFYGMSWREVMATPIRAFWVLVRNIDRVKAQEKLGELKLSVCAQSSEGVEEYQNDLVSQLGEVLVPDILVDTLDRTGFEELRSLSKSLT